MADIYDRREYDEPVQYPACDCGVCDDCLQSRLDFDEESNAMEAIVEEFYLERYECPQRSCTISWTPEVHTKLVNGVCPKCGYRMPE